MTGSRPAWFVLVAASVVACGGSDTPQASTPSAAPAPPPLGASNPPPSPPPADAKAASPAAAPSADMGWPYGPAQTPDERTAQLERLKKDPGPIKSNWTPPGKGDRYGHAEGMVDAVPSVVRDRLVDFAHYKDLAGPKFRSVRVVGKEGTSTDLYFQLPIMKGLITIWYVTRFGPSRAASAGEVIEGTFVKGNIKSMHITFAVRPGIDEHTSVLTCDLLLAPSVPAPQSAVDEELRDACGDAIVAVRRTLATPPP